MAIESTGYALWFHALMRRLGHTLLVGGAAKIRATVVRKTKTDRRDARHILTLLSEERFPAIWVPDPAIRDLRALIAHRMQLVRVRTMIRNGVHAIAMNYRLTLGTSSVCAGPRSLRPGVITRHAGSQGVAPKWPREGAAPQHNRGQATGEREEVERRDARRDHLEDIVVLEGWISEPAEGHARSRWFRVHRTDGVTALIYHDEALDTWFRRAHG